MNITKVEVFLRDDDKPLKAFVNLIFDDSFIVRNVKVIDGSNGMFVAMPNRQLGDGSYRDIAHPLNSDTRKEIEELVLQKYEEEKRNSEA